MNNFDYGAIVQEYQSSAKEPTQPDEQSITIDTSNRLQSLIDRSNSEIDSNFGAKQVAKAPPQDNKIHRGLMPTGKVSTITGEAEQEPDPDFQGTLGVETLAEMGIVKNKESKAQIAADAIGLPVEKLQWRGSDLVYRHENGKLYSLTRSDIPSEALSTTLSKVATDIPTAFSLIGGLAGAPGAVTGAMLGETVRQTIAGLKYEDEQTWLGNIQSLAGETALSLLGEAPGYIGKGGARRLINIGKKKGRQVQSLASGDFTEKMRIQGKRIAKEAKKKYDIDLPVTNATKNKGLRAQLNSIAKTWAHNDLATAIQAGLEAQVDKAIPRYIKSIDPLMSLKLQGIENVGNMIKGVAKKRIKLAKKTRKRHTDPLYTLAKEQNIPVSVQPALDTLDNLLREKKVAGETKELVKKWQKRIVNELMESRVKAKDKQLLEEMPLSRAIDIRDELAESVRATPPEPDTLAARIEDDIIDIEDMISSGSPAKDVLALVETRLAGAGGRRANTLRKTRSIIQDALRPEKDIPKDLKAEVSLDAADAWRDDLQRRIDLADTDYDKKLLITLKNKIFDEMLEQPLYKAAHDAFRLRSWKVNNLLADGELIGYVNKATPKELQNMSTHLIAGKNVKTEMVERFTREVLTQEGGRDILNASVMDYLSNAYELLTPTTKEAKGIGEAFRQAVNKNRAATNIEAMLTPTQWKGFNHFMDVLDRTGFTYSKEGIDKLSVIPEEKGLIMKGFRHMAAPLLTSRMYILDVRNALASRKKMEAVAKLLEDPASAFELARLKELPKGSSEVIEGLGRFLTRASALEVKEQATESR